MRAEKDISPITLSNNLYAVFQWEFSVLAHHAHNHDNVSDDTLYGDGIFDDDLFDGDLFGDGKEVTLVPDSSIFSIPSSRARPPTLMTLSSRPRGRARTSRRWCRTRRKKRKKRKKEAAWDEEKWKERRCCRVVGSLWRGRASPSYLQYGVYFVSMQSLLDTQRATSAPVSNSNLLRRQSWLLSRQSWTKADNSVFICLATARSRSLWNDVQSW